MDDGKLRKKRGSLPAFFFFFTKVPLCRSFYLNESFEFLSAVFLMFLDSKDNGEFPFVNFFFEHQVIMSIIRWFVRKNWYPGQFSSGTYIIFHGE